VIEGGQNPYRISSGSPEDVEAAARETRQWLAPAPREKLLALLSELYLKTAKVGASDEDFRARMEVYARCLSAYPADVACETLRGWRSTFFPTWDELASAIEGDRRISERRLRLDAFERFLCGKQDEKPKGNPVDANFIDEMKKKYSQSQSEVPDRGQ